MKDWETEDRALVLSRVGREGRLVGRHQGYPVMLNKASSPRWSLRKGPWPPQPHPPSSSEQPWHPCMSPARAGSQEKEEEARAQRRLFVCVGPLPSPVPGPLGNQGRRVQRGARADDQVGGGWMQGPD